MYRMFDIISDEWEVTSVEDTLRNFKRKVYERSKGGNHMLLHGEKPEGTGFGVYITMKRYTNYYVYTLLCPVIVMAVLGIFTICLQPNSDAKINMAITVFLGFIIIQTIIASLFPKSPEVPFLAYYNLFALTLAACNLAGTQIITGIYRISGKIEVPKYLLHAVEFLNLICGKSSRFCSKQGNSESVNEYLKAGKNSAKDLESKNEAKKDKRRANNKKNWRKLASLLNIIFILFYVFGNICIIILFFVPIIWQDSFGTSYLETLEIFQEEAYSHD